MSIDRLFQVIRDLRGILQPFEFFFSINFKREKFISERSFFSNLIINEAKDNCIILFEESRIRHPTFSHVCVLFSQLVATLLHVEFDGLQFSYRCLTRIYCTPFRSVSRFIQKYSENRKFYGCRSFLQLNFDTACLQAKKKEIAICPFLSSHFRNQRNDVSPEIFLPPTHKRIKSSLS